MGGARIGTIGTQGERLLTIWARSRARAGAGSARGAARAPRPTHQLGARHEPRAGPRLARLLRAAARRAIAQRAGACNATAELWPAAGAWTAAFEIVAATRMRKKPSRTAQSAMRSGRGPTRSTGRRAGRRRSTSTRRGSGGAATARPVIRTVRRDSGALNGAPIAGEAVASAAATLEVG